MLMERLFQGLTLKGANTSAKLDSLFRQKVQLEDQLKDVESQIHYARGVIDCIGETQGDIRDVQRQDSTSESTIEAVPTFKTASGKFDSASYTGVA